MQQSNIWDQKLIRRQDSSYQYMSTEKYNQYLEKWLLYCNTDWSIRPMQSDAFRKNNLGIPALTLKNIWFYPLTDTQKVMWRYWNQTTASSFCEEQQRDNFVDLFAATLYTCRVKQLCSIVFEGNVETTDLTITVKWHNTIASLATKLCKYVSHQTQMQANAALS